MFLQWAHGVHGFGNTMLGSSPVCMLTDYPFSPRQHAFAVGLDLAFSLYYPKRGPYHGTYTTLKGDPISKPYTTRKRDPIIGTTRGLGLLVIPDPAWVVPFLRNIARHPL